MLLRDTYIPHGHHRRDTPRRCTCTLQCTPPGRPKAISLRGSPSMSSPASGFDTRAPPPSMIMTPMGSANRHRQWTSLSEWQPSVHEPLDPAKSAFANWQAARRAKRRERQSRDTISSYASVAEPLLSRRPTDSLLDSARRREEGWRQPGAHRAETAILDAATMLPVSVPSTPATLTTPRPASAPLSQRAPRNRAAWAPQVPRPKVDVLTTTTPLCDDRLAWEPRALRLLQRHVRQQQGTRLHGPGKS